MTINWKKYAIILADVALVTYLVLAVTAFNKPDELTNVCGEVRTEIKDDVVKGFLNVDAVKVQLQRAGLFPLGEPMSNIKTRLIEEALLKNPFVETAQCYKTQTGRVCISLSQRLPVVHVMSADGDDYYVDTHGNIMPSFQYANDLVVATGSLNRNYAKKVLPAIGNFLVKDKHWRNQIEQLNILSDGSIEMVPRVGDHIVYLGAPSNFAHKLDRLDKFYKYGLSKAGWNKYSYISLEFDNQIICKKTKRVKE